MRLQNPFAAIGPTGLDSQVLCVLARTTATMGASQIHSVIPESGTDQGIRNALDRLVAQGTVTETLIGRTYGYTLNREHLLAPAIIAIASAKKRFIEAVASAVEAWSFQATTVTLFGSAARNEMQDDSDIDILVVIPDDVPSDVSEEATFNLTLNAGSWTGNDVRLLLYSESEVSPAPVFDSILREGIHIAGDADWLGLRLARTEAPA